MFHVIDALTVRQVAKLGWIAAGAWVLIGANPGRRWHRLIRGCRNLLGHRMTFAVITGSSLAVFCLAVAAQHLAMQTSSHDFGLMDEALAGTSGGRFMHTEVFGYSLLGEHFYLLMAALVPLRRLVGSPWVTLLAHAVVLWAALFPLRALLRRDRHPEWLVNFACLMYASHPIVARTLSYVFHPEAAYPFCVLSLIWCLRTGRWKGYTLALLATLAIKEDAAVYLIGCAVWIGFAERRMKVALVTAAVSIAWLFCALKVWMPAFGAPTESYRFIARWVEYGATPAGIILGMISKPHVLFQDLFSRQILLCFAGLGFLPFFSRWGWRVFVVPWIINATSVEPMQAGFGLYYGAPVLAFALPAVLAGMKTKGFRNVTAGRFGPALAIFVALLNIAHFDLPKPDPDRRSIVQVMALIPRGAPALIQPCLYPVGGYWAGKRPLMPEGKSPGADADYVAFLKDRHPWPFAPADLRALAAGFAGTGWTDISSDPAIHVFRRAGTPRPMGYDRKPK